MSKSTVLFILLAIWIAMPMAMAQKRGRRVSPTSKRSMTNAYLANKKYTSLGGSLNATNYFGDLTPKASFLSTDIRFTRPDISIFAMRRLSPRFTARASFSWGRLQGDDNKSASISSSDAKFRYVRNLHFRNDIKELAVTGIFDILANRRTFLKRPQYIPYIFAGIGVIYHNPKAKTPLPNPNTPEVATPESKWIDLQPLGTEGQGQPGYRKKYSRIQPVIPIGIGLRYKLRPQWDIAFEIGYRFTFTDYLDDVSGNYPDLANMDSRAKTMSYRSKEPIAAYSKKDREQGLRRFYNNDDPNFKPFANDAPGFGGEGDQRGSPKQKDVYLITGVHLSYLIPPPGRKSRFR